MPRLGALAAPSLPRHVHRDDAVCDRSAKHYTDSTTTRWRSLHRLQQHIATIGWPGRVRLALVALALMTVLKLTVLDPALFVANELFFTRYINGKRCEHIHHGHVELAFFDPSACLSRAEIQRILLGLVWTLADVFERHELPFWLDSGSLLGAYREKTVIPHDFDADVGIDAATYERLRDEDLALDVPSGYMLQVFAAKHLPHGTRNAGIPGRFVHTSSGLYVDLFVFFESRTIKQEVMYGPIPSSCFGDCRHCPKVAPRQWEFKIPKTWVYPLTSCDFGGRNVSCPAQPDKYLEYLYGSDFMTPREE